MARSMNPNSASSQFFICYSDDCTFLVGNYAAFGKVIDGFEEVKRIENVPLVQVYPEGVNATIKQPVEDEFMLDIEVETFGVEYPQPQIKYWVD